MSVKTEIYRRQRGLILRLLLDVYPNTMDLMVLYSVLSDIGQSMPLEILRGHLKYLGDSEKRYVVITERGSGAMVIEYVEITARGVDLMDNVKPESDPGVNIQI